jgi:hypothetical protein
MRLAEVNRRLIRIASAAKRGDHEAANGDERALFVALLRAVARGEAGSAEAKQALLSLDLEFSRWTA